MSQLYQPSHSLQGAECCFAPWAFLLHSLTGEPDVPCYSEDKKYLSMEVTKLELPSKWEEKCWDPSLKFVAQLAFFPPLECIGTEAQTVVVRWFLDQPKLKFVGRRDRGGTMQWSVTNQWKKKSDQAAVLSEVSRHKRLFSRCELRQ